MARILKESQTPRGMTEITFDIDGVKTGTVSIPTKLRHEITPEVLDATVEEIKKRSRIRRSE